MEAVAGQLQELLPKYAAALGSDAQASDAQAIGVQARLLIMKLKAANRHDTTGLCSDWLVRQVIVMMLTYTGTTQTRGRQPEGRQR